MDKKIAIIIINRDGVKIAGKLKRCFKNARVFNGQTDTLKDLVKVAFQEYEEIIIIAALGISVQNGSVSFGREILHPRKQGGSEVKTDLRIIVDDIDDLEIRIEDARGCVRGVALGVYPLVPVVVGISGILHLDDLEPGIFPGRLIEMPVDADIPDAGQVRHEEFPPSSIYCREWKGIARWRIGFFTAPCEESLSMRVIPFHSP